MDYNQIGIKHGRNFRELGGYETIDGHKIKYKKLLRTGNLAKLSDNDLSILNNYPVKFDIDFRSVEEKDKEPDRVPETSKYIFNPVFSQDLTESSISIEDLIMQSDNDGEFGFNNMLASYRDMVVGEDAQAAYQTFFKYLLENNDDGTLLFHCTAGKDRTGMGAFYLLTALGVPREVIIKDYLISNKTTKKFFDQTTASAQEAGASSSTIKSIQALMSVNEHYLNEAIKIMDDDFGGAEAYLKNILNIGKEEITELKNIYLD